MRSGGGAERARQVAEFVEDIGSEAGQGGAVALGRDAGIERRNGFGNVGGERVGANLQFDDIGGRAVRGGRMAPLVAQGLNGSVNFRGIFRNERELLAVDFEGLYAVVRN